MELTITGRQVEVTEAIHDYAASKADKLPRYFDRVRSAEILLDKSDSHHFEVETVVHIDGHDPAVATAKDEDLYRCIDQSLSKAERQLHDVKERLRDRKH